MLEFNASDPAYRELTSGSIIAIAIQSVLVAFSLLLLVACMSQNYADTCPGGHSAAAERNYTGENLAWGEYYQNLFNHRT